MVGGRYFFSLEVLRQVCRKGGLAEMHFGWSATIVQLLRRNIRWLIDLGVPSVCIVAFFYNLGEDRFEHSLGRLCFAIAMLLSCFFLIIVLKPRTGVFRDYIEKYRGGWVDRLRYFWYVSLTSAPLLLCVNSMTGYHYTAFDCRCFGTPPS